MSRTAKIAIIVILVVIAALVYYFFFFKTKTVETTDIVDENGMIKVPPMAGTVQIQNDNFPLTQGMQGANIARLQTALNYIKPTNLIKVDGKFGSQTFGKLATTVNAYLSNLPMSEKNFNEIIALGNRAKGA